MSEFLIMCAQVFTIMVWLTIALYKIVNWLSEGKLSFRTRRCENCGKCEMVINQRVYCGVFEEGELKPTYCKAWEKRGD